jgi:hypothetical protein
LIIAFSVALPFVVIALAIGIAAILPPPPNVNKASFDSIKDGMTKSEVEEIFRRKGTSVPTLQLTGKTEIFHWKSDDEASWAAVIFVDDCVTGKSWQKMP